MSDVLTFETTKAFCAQFKEVKTLARAGAIIELHEGSEVFIFQRKPGTGGFFGAMRGKVSSRAATEELLSSGDTWEADQ